MVYRAYTAKGQSGEGIPPSALRLNVPTTGIYIQIPQRTYIIRRYTCCVPIYGTHVHPRRTYQID
jgi:hypothetical protein